MKVRFIINPVAGGIDRTGQITDAVRESLKDEDGFFEIRASNGKGNAAELSREAVSKGFDFVFACGGDGTINEVASQLVETGVGLGIIPAGSGNALAKTLGIPQKPLDSISLLKKKRIRRIDAGFFCGRYFFTTAGFAFEAYLCKKYNEGSITKKIRGLAPYVPLALFEFFRFKPEEITLKIDNRPIELSPFLLTVANIERYGGEALIAPGAVPDDGLFDVCIVPAINIKEAARLAMKLFKGSIPTHKQYSTFRAARIELDKNTPFYAHADGEPFTCEGPIKIELVPKSLNILVP